MKNENAAVELVCWKNNGHFVRVKKDAVVCAVGLPIKEDNVNISLSSTYGNRGWTDTVVIKKEFITERRTLNVIEKKKHPKQSKRAKSKTS